MHGITQNPTAKYWKICWNLGKKRRVWRIVKKWKHAEKTASQKDLYHNIFWHIIKKINEKSHWIHFLHILMEIQLFFQDLFLFSVFCCGSQGLWSPWPGDDVFPKDVAPGMCHLHCSSRLAMGMGRKRSGCFPGRDGVGKPLCVRNLPPALTQYIPHVWGLKWNPFTSSLLSRVFCRHSFILHCITYIKTRAEKFLLGPFFFFLFYDSAWISKHFRIRQGEKEKVLAAFI